MTTSAFPVADEVLVEKVRALAAELGGWPSKRAVMRAAGVGRPRASAALDLLRAEGFDPTVGRSPTVRVGDVGTLSSAQGAHVPERTQDEIGSTEVVDAAGRSQQVVRAHTGAAEIDGEALADPAADAATPVRARRVPRWPILIIAAGAFISIWSGWVGLGKLTGFGPVALLPGIADEWVINSAITLPIGVEAYASLALWGWLSDAPVSRRARTFARRSAIGSLILGAAGQGAYHLMIAAGITVAPWPITVLVAALPVVVLGCAAALVHLIHQQGGDR